MATAAKCKFCVTGAPAPKRCPYCHYCLLHQRCVCVECRKCRKRVGPKDICLKCRCCVEHHAKGTYVGKDFPVRTCQYEVSPATTFLLNPLQRTIGVEVECSNIANWDSPPTKILKYAQDHDGSVKPSNAEFVLTPAAGDRLQKGLLEFLRHLHAADCTMNSTCGYHVHVDAADLAYTDLRRVLALFALMQRQMFDALLAPSRWGNIYCAPVRDNFKQLAALFKLSNPLVKEWFHHKLYGIQAAPGMDLQARRIISQQLAQKKSHKYEHAARRHALNFHSWMMRGTIEFRCKEGTMDQGDFLLWPLWCGWFVEAAIRKGGKHCVGYTDEEIVDMLLKNQAPALMDFTTRFMPPVVQSWVKSRLETRPAEPELYIDPNEPRRTPILQRFEVDTPNQDVGMVGGAIGQGLQQDLLRARAAQLFGNLTPYGDYADGLAANMPPAPPPARAPRARILNGRVVVG